MKVAFYAPMKAPDHPVPSGDRQMARLLIEALRLASHEVVVASRFRSFVVSPDRAKQAELLAQAKQEAVRIARGWAKTGRPDLWFTYHNHYKAPDLLGSELTQEFSLPFVVAEASHARKRAVDWGQWHEAAEGATRAADVHLSFTLRDRDGIAPLLHSGATLLDLRPFIDCRAHPLPVIRAEAQPSVSIATVAMMRPGDKLDSYRFLAAALAYLDDASWNLTLIGDGPARSAVEAAFASFPPERIRWCGALSGPAVIEAVRRADLFAWPGFGEAFGLAYLEAQALGLPVVALDVAGVSSVVRDGEGGVLVVDPSPEAYAKALRRFLRDPEILRAMGYAAAIRIRRDHSIEAASQTLSRALDLAQIQRRATAGV